MTTPTFPIAPNWATSYRVTREFRTTVWSSRSGKEQRRTLRVTPRKRIQFELMAIGQQAIDFARWLRANVGYTMQITDESRSVKTTGAMAFFTETTGSVTFSSNAVALTAAPYWLAAGAAVMLRQGNQSEARTVYSVSGTTVTLLGLTALDWPIGTQILPLLQGRLDPTGLKIDLASDAVARGTVNFSVTPASEIPYSPPAAPATFNGRELFLVRPNWSNAPQVTFGRPFNTVDYSEGRVDYFNHIAYVSRAEEANFLGLSRAQVCAIEDLFIRMKGQQGEFYKPTWLNDIPPIEVSAIGSSIIRQNGTDFANNFASDTVFLAIYIQYNDGTYLCCVVASVIPVAGYSEVVLADPLTRAVDPATVSFISWLPVHRFSSDTLDTDWITDSVGELKLSLKTLEDLTAETA